MRRWIWRFSLFIGVIYLLPAGLALGHWWLEKHPAGWRQANWASAHVLPKAADMRQAAVYIFSAHTGGLKGALARHSWIVLKDKNAPTWTRYDKVGWGKPVRENAWPADAFWYSNRPEIAASVTGVEAERVIPQLRSAIAAYPYDHDGGYRIWPGPNSNTFVASVLRSVPDLPLVLPPDATGRDFLSGGKLVYVDWQNGDAKLSLFGLIGLSAGRLSGLEVEFLGLVASFDLVRPGIKVPGWGTFSWSDSDSDEAITQSNVSVNAHSLTAI